MRKRIYKRPFLLYHWAPVARRQSILKHGLRVHSPTVAHSGPETWPHICFSDSPSLAWALSARFLNRSSMWDLWMCWSNVTSKPIGRRDGLTSPTEFRIFENIAKRWLWHVGTREHSPRKRIACEPLHYGGKVKVG